MLQILQLLFILIIPIFFFLGNFIYSEKLDISLIIRILCSEGSFIVMYTLVDKLNIISAKNVYLWFLPIFIIFYHPIFNFVFFNQYVQIASVTITLVALIIDSNILMYLHKKLHFSVLKSSRISSIVASVIEAGIFSYLLQIGLKGFFITILVRVIYIFVITKIIFSLLYQKKITEKVKF